MTDSAENPLFENLEGTDRLLEITFKEYGSLFSNPGSGEEAYPKILASAMRISGCARGRLLKLKEGEEKAEYRAESSREGGPRFLERISQGSGREAEAWAGASLTLPLRSSSAIYGVLQLHYPQEKGPFPEARLEILKSFGAAASTLLESLHNARNLEREIQLLKELSQAVHLLLVAGHAPEEVAGLALDEAMRLSTCQRGVFLVRDLGTGIYGIPAQRGLSREELQGYLDAPLSEGAGPLLLKLLRGREDATPADFRGQGGLAGLFPVESRPFYCLTVAEGGELFGILMLAGAGSEGPEPSPSLRGFLQLFADQAGMALRNSMLYRQLSQKKRDLETATESLVQNEKLALAGRMAAAVAHQVRNPLSVIGATVQILMSQLPQEDPRLKDLETMLSKVSEADSAIRDLMELARPIDVNPVLADIGASLQAIQKFVLPRCKTQKVELEVRVDPGLPKVWADEVQFQRCVLEIGIHALLVLKEGNKLRLLARASDSGQGLEVRVEDDGPGISPAQLARVFEPFYMPKATQQGLGLFNVRRFCEAMGVRVEAANLQPCGASYRFYFDVSKERPAAIRGEIDLPSKAEGVKA